MWPRLIAQLLELLPHATRLLPMADNYLSTRRDTDHAQTRAISAMSETVRGDIDQIAASHTALARQIVEQKSQIVALHETLSVLQTQNLTHTRQLEWLTNDVNSMRVWIKFGTVIIVLLLLGVGGLCGTLVFGH